MKRRDLVQHLVRHGCFLKRDDGKHSVYWNPATGATALVPRHRELSDHTARGICRQLGIPSS